MRYNKYVGIPFVHHGRDETGVDCYGLVRFVLEKEFNKTLPDFWAYENAEDVTSISGLFSEYTDILGSAVQEPTEGDVVLFRFKGYTSHIGLYVGQGKVIHVMRGMNSVCVPIDKGLLRGRTVGYFRVK